jgi:hypothetical protein
LVSGWQPAAAAEAGGGAITAAAVVGAGAGAAAACDGGEVVCTRCGGVFCAVAGARVACWLGARVAVGEALVVRAAAVRLPCADGDPPEFATAMMMMISAAKPKTPVSALWRVGQDLPRVGFDGCGGP